jgi:hypothetical protein
MITVEDVIEKKSEEQPQPGQPSKVNSTGKVRKSYLPWIFLAIGALVGGYLLLRKKGSGSNEGVSS